MDDIEPTTEPGSGTPDVDALRAENERLRSEQAALETQLAEASASARKSRHPVRTFFAWLLAILAIIALVISVAAVWMQTTLGDTDTFVATLEPLPQDEAVAAAISVTVADSFVEATGIQTAVANSLPQQINFIAAPITEGIQQLTTRATQAVIQTDAFTAVWRTALRATQTAAEAVLTGNDAALEAEGGSVSINLDTIAEPVTDALTEAGIDVSGLVGDDFTLGDIELYQSDELAEAQAFVEGVQTLGWLIPLIALVLIVLAILVAADRRRIIAILGFGTAIGMLVMLVSLRITRRLTVGTIDDAVNQDAGEAAWDILLRNWTGALWAIAFLGLVVGFVAWFVGPSPRAEGSREAISDRLAQRSGTRTEEPTGFAGFLYRSRRPVEWTIMGLGILVLLIAPLTLWVALITVVVVVVLLAVVEVIAGPKVSETDEAVVVAATPSDEETTD